MKRLLHIVLALVLAAACRGPRVIPKDTLAAIYTEMFLADRKVQDMSIPHSQMDTMLLYEAIFEKYGYDTDDYQYSLQHYLRDPERFTKVFEGVSKRLQEEIDALDKLIERRDRENAEAQKTYPQIDSILAPFSKAAFYAGQARMERDTALYAALYRLVAVQEDTLMMPVDSVEARARRDTLAVAKDTLKVEAADKDAKAGKEKLVPERPVLKVPPGRGKSLPPKFRQKEIVAEEEAVEEVAVEEHAE